MAKIETVLPEVGLGIVLFNSIFFQGLSISCVNPKSKVGTVLVHSRMILSVNKYPLTVVNTFCGYPLFYPTSSIASQYDILWVGYDLKYIGYQICLVILCDLNRS